MKNSKSIFTTKSIILCGLFAALIAVGAFIRIPLPLIPFTLQLFFVGLAGVLLGSKLGFISVAVYIAVGLVGFPVFTKGGGLQYIFEPSFGFLVGFAVCAFVIGFYLEKKKSKKFIDILIACVLGVLVSYILGVVHMYFILNLYLGKETTIWSVCWSGAIIFAPKDLFLCFVTGLVGNRMMKLPTFSKA